MTPRIVSSLTRCLTSFLRPLATSRSSIVAVALGAFALAAPASAQLKISQVYNFGGSATFPGAAVLSTDYVEIYNPTGSPVTMTNWAVQHTTSTGTVWTANTINGTVGAGKYFLVAFSTGTSAVAPAIPAPDATFAAVNLGSTSSVDVSTYKLALTNTNTALSGADPTTASIQDFVGIGTGANGREPHTTGTTANNAPPTSNVLAVYRQNCGNQDTDVNNADWANGYPSPRNSATPAASGLTAIGTAFPYSNFLPAWDQARAVQIDRDPKMIGLRFPTEVNLVGDSGDTLRALIPLLRRKSDREWRQQVEENVAEWWELMEAQAYQSADPVNPQLLFWELSKRLPDGAILTADSGTTADWYARDIRLRRGMRGSLSGNLATMGPGVPYALAAKLAFPDRPVFALVGDGAMQMNGMNELLTIAKYRDHWIDPRFVILVLANRDLNMVTWEMRTMQGNPKYEASQAVPALDHARFAELCGLRGIRVERPEDVGPAWDDALAADGPVVIDALCDPEVPPLPPHVTLEEARNFTRAVLKGDPGAAAMIRQSFKKKVRELIPT